MESGPWNWLEVARIGASVLTPIALAVLGIYVHRTTKRFEHSQWRSQKLVEKRLAIYDDLAPLLNDLLCYFLYVGSWRNVTPLEAVALKRTIDKKIYLASPLFSQEFFESCMAFQNTCFETYRGPDAKLRTAFKHRKDGLGSTWQDEWGLCFSAHVAERSEVSQAYWRIMRVFSVEIGVNDTWHASLNKAPPSVV